MAIFDTLRRSLLSRWTGDSSINKWNGTFFGLIGGKYTHLDANNKTYVSDGFQKNSAVFSVIQQRYQKVRAVPYYLKRVKDDQKIRELDGFIKATNYDFAPNQVVKHKRLLKRAFEENSFPMPLKKPNPLQGWGSFFATYEMYMALTGNCFIYMLRTGEGVLGNEPVAIYLLPSHLMKIVVKEGVDLLKVESPIDGYILEDGFRFMDFTPDEVIHIKLPNPDFTQNGDHLYGQSPIRAALRNLESFNEATDNNGKMMRNSGAFGLIHGKGNRSLTNKQARQLKQRLEEMDATKGRLSQIAGVSAEIGFTRIAMTTDELKPFDFLNFDEKQIANALGWDTRLLNQDSGATFDNLKIAQKRVIISTTKPSLDLLCEALNEHFIPLFRRGGGLRLVFDFSELPEMQVNMKELVEWLSQALDRGVINRNEFREAMGYDRSEDDWMNTHTISQFLEPLKEAIEDPFSMDNTPPIRNPDLQQAI